MGLFDSLRGSGADTPLDVQRAVMVVLIAAVQADGIVEDEEVVQIRSICALSPIFSSNTAEQDGRVIQFAVQFVDSEGVSTAVQKAAASLSPRLRETAFAFAARVAIADGFLGKGEEELLAQLVAWLQLDGDRARQIVEVLEILNRRSEA